MNTYIQDKLDEFKDKKKEIKIYYDLKGGVVEVYWDKFEEYLKQSLTDYHNHIVEEIEEYANSQTDKTIAIGIIGTISLLKD